MQSRALAASGWRRGSEQGGAPGDSIRPEDRTHREARPGEQGQTQGRQGSGFPHKCGVASGSKKPDTQSIEWLEAAL